MWPVDESVYAHIFDGFWLSEEVKHCLMATSNHRCEGVDHFDEWYFAVDRVAPVCKAYAKRRIFLRVGCGAVDIEARCSGDNDLFFSKYTRIE